MALRPSFMRRQNRPKARVLAFANEKSGLPGVL